MQVTCEKIKNKIIRMYAREIYTPLYLKPVLKINEG